MTEYSSRTDKNRTDRAGEEDTDFTAGLFGKDEKDLDGTPATSEEEYLEPEEVARRERLRNKELEERDERLRKLREKHGEQKK